MLVKYIFLLQKLHVNCLVLELPGFGGSMSNETLLLVDLGSLLILHSKEREREREEIVKKVTTIDAMKLPMVCRSLCIPFILNVFLHC